MLSDTHGDSYSDPLIFIQTLFLANELTSPVPAGISSLKLHEPILVLASWANLIIPGGIYMLRKFAILMGLFFVLSLSAHAQISDKVELFGGYSYMRFDSSPITNMNGYLFSGEYKPNSWFGGVAEFGGEYGNGAGVHTFLFGPQISGTGRVSPFAHVLIGVAHFSANGGSLTDNSFSLAAGAGVDARIFHGVYWRVLEADYVPTFFFGSRQDNGRASTGIVIKF